jgi:dipeptidyl aminopeptidase/acylaminoacyl peptidase
VRLSLAFVKPRRKLKRALGIVAALVVLGAIALNLLAYRHAHAMMHFAPGGAKTEQAEALTAIGKLEVLLCGVNLPRPETTIPATILGPKAETIAIDGEHGVKLGAWYCPAEPSRPLVILFHGYGADKSATVPEARAFLAMNFPVLLVDFRGSGDSSESFTTIGFEEAEDVAAAVRYARGRFPASKVILYGQSMGASAVLRSVQSCGVQPDGIIVEAVFDRMLNTVRHRFEAMHVPSFPCAELLVFWGGHQFGFDAFAHNPVDYAASVPCPILFFHGSADPRARVSEARRVYEAIPGAKTFHEFAALRHEPAVKRFPGEWTGAVSQFLRTNETAQAR